MLQALRLENDIALVASDDVLRRKLQDLNLEPKCRAPRRKPAAARHLHPPNAQPAPRPIFSLRRHAGRAVDLFSVAVAAGGGNAADGWRPSGVVGGFVIAWLRDGGAGHTGRGVDVPGGDGRAVAGGGRFVFRPLAGEARRGWTRL